MTESRSGGQRHGTDRCPVPSVPRPPTRIAFPRLKVQRMTGTEDNLVVTDVALGGVGSGLAIKHFGGKLRVWLDR